jgi:hypothetical protein
MNGKGKQNNAARRFLFGGKGTLGLLQCINAATCLQVIWLKQGKNNDV